MKKFMSNLLKSKFLFGVLTVAIMFVGAVAFNATTASADCAITTTLKLGSKGAEVVCLQTSLGGLTADGSFGLKTRAKVVAWQAGASLVVDGVFGAKSRTAWMNRLNSISMGFTAGCTSTVGYSPTTGMKCGRLVNTSLPPGCSSTSGYSPTTGVKCSGTVSSSSNSGGGSSNRGNSSTTQSSSVTISSPTSNSSVTQGQTLRIAWNTTNAPAGSYVDTVNLFRGDVLVQRIISTRAYTASDLFDWGVSSAITAGDNYRIQVMVKNSGGSSLAQTMSGYFRVVAPTSNPSSSVTLTSPSTNSSVTQGQTLRIAWNTTNAPSSSYVGTVNLLRGDEVVQSIVSSNSYEASDLMDWGVSSNITAGDNYRIQVQVKNADGSILAQTISGYFRVVAPAISTPSSTITITSPATGSSVTQGQLLRIAWNTTNAPAGSYVDTINLFRGNDLAQVIISTPSYGASDLLDWGISGAITAGTNYRIQVAVKNADGSPLVQTFSNNFTVVAPVALNTSGSAVLGAQSFYFTQFLSEGSHGTQVTELQKYLKTRGYDVGDVDGVFDEQVKVALMKFQTEHGLKSDGIVGYEVRTFLNK